MHPATPAPWNIPYGFNTVLHRTVILFADLLLGYFNTNKAGPRHRHWQWSTIICSDCKHSLLHCFGSCQVALSRKHPGTAQETSDAKDCFQATIWTWTSCFEDKGSKREHMEVIHCHAAWTQILGRSIQCHRSCFPVQSPKAELCEWGINNAPYSSSGKYCLAGECSTATSEMFSAASGLPN